MTSAASHISSRQELLIVQKDIPFSCSKQLVLICPYHYQLFLCSPQHFDFDPQYYIWLRQYYSHIHDIDIDSTTQTASHNIHSTPNTASSSHIAPHFPSNTNSKESVISNSSNYSLNTPHVSSFSEHDIEIPGLTPYNPILVDDWDCSGCGCGYKYIIAMSDQRTIVGSMAMLGQRDSIDTNTTNNNPNSVFPQVSIINPTVEPPCSSSSTASPESSTNLNLSSICNPSHEKKKQFLHRVAFVGTSPQWCTPSFALLLKLRLLRCYLVLIQRKLLSLYNHLNTTVLYPCFHYYISTPHILDAAFSHPQSMHLVNYHTKNQSSSLPSSYNSNQLGPVQPPTRWKRQKRLQHQLQSSSSNTICVDMIDEGDNQNGHSIPEPPQHLQTVTKSPEHPLQIAIANIHIQPLEQELMHKDSHQFLQSNTKSQQFSNPSLLPSPNSSNIINPASTYTGIDNIIQLLTTATFTNQTLHSIIEYWYLLWLQHHNILSNQPTSEYSNTNNNTTHDLALDLMNPTALINAQATHSLSQLQSSSLNSQSNSTTQQDLTNVDTNSNHLNNNALLTNNKSPILDSDGDDTLHKTSWCHLNDTAVRFELTPDDVYKIPYYLDSLHIEQKKNYFNRCEQDENPVKNKLYKPRYLYVANSIFNIPPPDLTIFNTYRRNLQLECHDTQNRSLQNQQEQQQEQEQQQQQQQQQQQLLSLNTTSAIFENNSPTNQLSLVSCTSAPDGNTKHTKHIDDANKTNLQSGFTSLSQLNTLNDHNFTPNIDHNVGLYSYHSHSPFYSINFPIIGYGDLLLPYCDIKTALSTYQELHNIMTSNTTHGNNALNNGEAIFDHSDQHSSIHLEEDLEEDEDLNDEDDFQDSFDTDEDDGDNISVDSKPSHITFSSTIHSPNITNDPSPIHSNPTIEPVSSNTATFPPSSTQPHHLHSGHITPNIVLTPWIGYSLATTIIAASLSSILHLRKTTINSCLYSTPVSVPLNLTTPLHNQHNQPESHLTPSSSTSIHSDIAYPSHSYTNPNSQPTNSTAPTTTQSSQSSQSSQSPWIWIHSYQMMLLPSKLRDISQFSHTIPYQPPMYTTPTLLSSLAAQNYNSFHIQKLYPYHSLQNCDQARLLFSLHSPWPPSDIFSFLPWRTHLLKSCLAVDVITFQSYDFARHFLTSCTRLLDFKSNLSAIQQTIASIIQSEQENTKHIKQQLQNPNQTDENHYETASLSHNVTNSRNRTLISDVGNDNVTPGGLMSQNPALAAASSTSPPSPTSVTSPPHDNFIFDESIRHQPELLIFCSIDQPQPSSCSVVGLGGGTVGLFYRNRVISVYNSHVGVRTEPQIDKHQLSYFTTPITALPLLKQVNSKYIQQIKKSSIISRTWLLTQHDIRESTALCTLQDQFYFTQSRTVAQRNSVQLDFYDNLLRNFLQYQLMKYNHKRSSTGQGLPILALTHTMSINPNNGSNGQNGPNGSTDRSNEAHNTSNIGENNANKLLPLPQFARSNSAQSVLGQQSYDSDESLLNIAAEYYNFNFNTHNIELRKIEPYLRFREAFLNQNGFNIIQLSQSTSPPLSMIPLSSTPQPLPLNQTPTQTVPHSNISSHSYHHQTPQQLQSPFQQQLQQQLVQLQQPIVLTGPPSSSPPNENANISNPIKSTTLLSTSLSSASSSASIDSSFFSSKSEEWCPTSKLIYFTDRVREILLGENLPFPFVSTKMTMRTNNIRHLKQSSMSDPQSNNDYIKNDYISNDADFLCTCIDNTAANKYTGLLGKLKRAGNVPFLSLFQQYLLEKHNAQTCPLHTPPPAYLSHQNHDHNYNVDNANVDDCECNSDYCSACSECSKREQCFTPSTPSVDAIDTTFHQSTLCDNISSTKPISTTTTTTPVISISTSSNPITSSSSSSLHHPMFSPSPQQSSVHPPTSTNSSIISTLSTISSLPSIPSNPLHLKAQLTLPPHNIPKKASPLATNPISFQVSSSSGLSSQKNVSPPTDNISQPSHCRSSPLSPSPHEDLNVSSQSQTNLFPPSSLHQPQEQYPVNYELLTTSSRFSKPQGQQPTSPETRNPTASTTNSQNTSQRQSHSVFRQSQNQNRDQNQNREQQQSQQILNTIPSPQKRRLIVCMSGVSPLHAPHLQIQTYRTMLEDQPELALTTTLNLLLYTGLSSFCTEGGYSPLITTNRLYNVRNSTYKQNVSPKENQVKILSRAQKLADKLVQKQLDFATSQQHGAFHQNGDAHSAVYCGGSSPRPRIETFINSRKVHQSKSHTNTTNTVKNCLTCPNTSNYDLPNVESLIMNSLNEIPIPHPSQLDVITPLTTDEISKDLTFTTLYKYDGYHDSILDVESSITPSFDSPPTLPGLDTIDTTSINANDADNDAVTIQNLKWDEKWSEQRNSANLIENQQRTFLGAGIHSHLGARLQILRNHHPTVVSNNPHSNQLHHIQSSLLSSQQYQSAFFVPDGDQQPQTGIGNGGKQQQLARTQSTNNNNTFGLINQNVNNNQSKQDHHHNNSVELKCSNKICICQEELIKLSHLHPLSHDCTCVRMGPYIHSLLAQTQCLKHNYGDHIIKITMGVMAGTNSFYYAHSECQPHQLTDHFLHVLCPKHQIYKLPWCFRSSQALYRSADVILCNTFWDGLALIPLVSTTCTMQSPAAELFLSSQEAKSIQFPYETLKQQRNCTCFGCMEYKFGLQQPTIVKQTTTTTTTTIIQIDADNTAVTHAAVPPDLKRSKINKIAHSRQTAQTTHQQQHPNALTHPTFSTTANTNSQALTDIIDEVLSTATSTSTLSSTHHSHHHHHHHHHCHHHQTPQSQPIPQTTKTSQSASSYTILHPSSYFRAPPSVIVSEFQGSSRSVPGVVRSNPLSIKEVAQSLSKCVQMGDHERYHLHLLRYNHSYKHPFLHWAAKCLNLLQESYQRNVSQMVQDLPPTNKAIL